MRTGFAVIWLWLLPSLAMAQESIPPIEELEAIRVEWDVGNRSYYPIPAGSALSFDTPGPISLRVEVRIRIPVDTNLEERPRIMALGDGMNFMSIEASYQPATDGQIYDAMGGVPSVALRASLDVPPEGRVLSLQAPADGPDFLIFLSRDVASETIIASPTVAPTDPDEGPWADYPDAEPSEGTSDEPSTIPAFDDEPDTIATEVETASAPTEISPPESVVETETDIIEPSLISERLGLLIGPLSGAFDTLHLGVRAGVGLPSWGSGAVPRVAAQAAIPVISDLGRVALSLGWYRLSVNDREILVDPFIGAHQMEWSWHTNVFDISAEFVGEIPFALGPVRPIAGGGLNLYWARRDEAGVIQSGFAPGAHVLIGGRYALPVGVLEAGFGWNGGRRAFENQGQDGRPVRESLAATHLDLTWMMEIP